MLLQSHPYFSIAPSIKIALINKLPGGKASIILLRRTYNYHCGVDTRHSWNKHRSFINLNRLTGQKEIGRIFHKFWKALLVKIRIFREFG